MTRIRILLVTFCLLVASPMTFAHAILVRSSPADGSTVHQRNLVLVLNYNSRIEASRCTLRLTRADGKLVPLRMVASGKPAELRATVNNLKNGKYTVHWQALATDGHITRGDIAFAVAVK